MSSKYKYSASLVVSMPREECGLLDKRGMGPFGIVETFDVSKYRKLQFLEGMLALAVCFHFFEVFEKAFAAGIVKGIAFLGKRLNGI